MIKEPICTEHIIEYLLFLILYLDPVFGYTTTPIPVKISMLHVPTPVVTGDNVLLRCAYELGNETLYAIKWYRNMAEFYRYVPGSEPTFKTFPQIGINVDVSKSESSSVYLRNLSLESYGNYTCQVSTDKPFFRCVQTTRPLEVLVPPSDGPVLMEEKSDYELGDNVSILCNSGKSKPAPDLKWYINDQLAPSELYDKETVVYPDQLESSSLALRFHLKPEVLHNGKVTLKCVATVKHISAVTTKEIRASAHQTTATIGQLILMLSMALVQKTLSFTITSSISF